MKIRLSSASPYSVFLVALLGGGTIADVLADPAADVETVVDESASPLPKTTAPPRSTRPGRSGRDLGSRAQPQPSESVDAAPARQPEASATPPAIPPEQPAASVPRPGEAPKQVEQPLSREEAFRQEQEQRRKLMESKQQEAEAIEKARRAARLQELERQHEEAK